MGSNIILLQAFNEFDVDGGGNISTKELGWAMRAMGMNPTENDLLELINEVYVVFCILYFILYFVFDLLLCTFILYFELLCFYFLCCILYFVFHNLYFQSFTFTFFLGFVS